MGSLEKCSSENRVFEIFQRAYTRKTEILLSGSIAELPMRYVFQNLTDLDLMIIPTDTVAVESFEHQGVSTREYKNLLLIDDSQTEVGFVKLVSPGKGEFYSRLLGCDTDLVKGPSLRKNFFDIFSKYHHRISTVTDIVSNIYNFSVDKVLSIKCLKWPKIAREWVTRERRHGWPSTDLIESIVADGCHFVTQPERGAQWRYSFSKAEVQLLNTWIQTQKYCYHILRLILKDLINLFLPNHGKSDRMESEDCETCKRVFCSYSLKTLMLWKCETNPVEFWDENKLAEAIESLVLSFSECLIEKKCQNYFIPTFNMWKHVEFCVKFEDAIHHLISLCGSKSLEHYLNKYSVLEEPDLSLKNSENVNHQAILSNICGTLVLQNLNGFNKMLPFEKFLVTSEDLRKLCEGLSLQKQHAKLLRNRVNCDLAMAIGHYFENPCTIVNEDQQNPALFPNSVTHLSLYQLVQYLFKCHTFKMTTASRNISSRIDESQGKAESKNVSTRFHQFALLLIRESLSESSSNSLILPSVTSLEAAFRAIAPVFLDLVAAYRANFYYMVADSVDDFQRVVEICDEVIRRDTESITVINHKSLPILLTYELLDIYDRRIQSLIGYIVLSKSMIFHGKNRSNNSSVRDFYTRLTDVTLLVPAYSFVCYIRQCCLCNLEEQSTHGGSVERTTKVWRALIEIIKKTRTRETLDYNQVRFVSPSIDRFTHLLNRMKLYER